MADSQIKAMRTKKVKRNEKLAKDQNGFNVV
jgi:hypothetical protein